MGIEGHDRPGEGHWIHAMADDSERDVHEGDIKGERAWEFVKRH